MWCETLRQTESFPQPDSTFRTPTAEEYEIYGHGKPPLTNKVANKHVPNLVVYDNVPEDGDAPATSSVGVDDVVTPYDDPILSRIRLRSYSAAARSATQSTADEFVARGVAAGSPLLNPLYDDVSSLHTATQTDHSYGF